MDVEVRPKKKMSKFDSLKPITNYLEVLLVRHGLSQHNADLVVFDIAERFVTAGFGWDKVLQYHSKVCAEMHSIFTVHGNSIFNSFLSIVKYDMVTGAGRVTVHQEVDPARVHVKG